MTARGEVSEGFVYCLVHHERNAVKIGFSRKPARRMKQIQTGVADPLTLYGVIPGDRALETAFHQQFAPLRLHGEWFDDTSGVIKGVVAQMAWEAACA